MRRLAFLFVFMSLAGTAFADGLDDAALRGSSGFEVPARGAPIYAADAPYYPLEDDMPVKAPVYQPVVPAVQEIWVEIGGRFWYSTGTFSKNLYDDVRFSNDLLSRLTYGALSGRSYEIFGRVDHASGFFVKGNVGLGSINAGTLHDEDFPPALVPYSNTLSDQHNGQISYFTLDFGYNFLLTPLYRVGAFVGYNMFNEAENAYGCTQTQSNPFVCVPAIPPNVLAITENSRWQSIRLGLAGDALLFECFRIGGDVAWVPYTNLRSFDTHWLRQDIFSPIYEPGKGSGVQLEAFANYNFTPAFSVGVGARYWRLTAKGTIDVEDAALLIGGMPQPGTFFTDRYGVFVQTAYKFGLD
jgi:outer membrane protease